mgnify:CR=1 FL=1
MTLDLGAGSLILFALADLDFEVSFLRLFTFHIIFQHFVVKLFFATDHQV